MNTDPKPATTLSAEDAAHLETITRYGTSDYLKAARIIRDLEVENAALTERLRVAETGRDVWAERATSNESRRWNLEQRVNLVRTIEYVYDSEAGCRCHPMQSGVEPCEYHSGYIDALEAVAAALADPSTSNAAPKEAT